MPTVTLRGITVSEDLFLSYATFKVIYETYTSNTLEAIFDVTQGIAGILYSRGKLYYAG